MKNVCITVQNYFINFVLTESLKRVEEITGKKIEFQKVNLLDKEGLDNLFKKVSFLWKLEIPYSSFVKRQNFYKG